MTTVRCPWADKDPLLIDYHDSEWGVPEHDDRALFEKLVLDGFQAGLSWLIVLKKRDNFRRAFDGFDPEKIARYDARKVAALMNDPGIVRNRAKIEGARASARAYLRILEDGGSFDRFLWQFTDGRTLRPGRRRPAELPAETAQSRAMSKALRQRGFKFVGPTICYAFMQAIGMVNDHVVSCFRYPVLTERMIRACGEGDLAAVHAVINDAARAYRSVIPADCWREPYMPFAELEDEIAAGVAFLGYEEGGALIGVMGTQPVADVMLIRHAYVASARRRAGIGSALLTTCLARTRRPVLIGTWAAASWAIDFYRKHGFTVIGGTETDRLLATYWSIPARQVETSVVLADRRWRARRNASPHISPPSRPASRPGLRSARSGPKE